MRTGRTSIAKLPRAVRILGLVATATAALALGGCTNRVPNHGFEVGGCGTTTPDLCRWEASDYSGPSYIAQDTTNPHAGAASMSLFGGYADGAATANTDPTFCATISPGTHAASFWYRTPDTGSPPSNVGSLQLSASFFSGPDCTGWLGSDSQSVAPIRDDAWHKVTGALVAPPGAAAATFSFAIGGDCDNDFVICSDFSAHVDDIDVEAEVSP
jgi:hypothetical protein